MKRSIATICMSVSLLIIPISLVTESEVVAQSFEIHDWIVEFRSDKAPTSNNVAVDDLSYTLKNETEGKRIGYGRREYGINLVWGPALPPDSGNIRFKRRTGTGSLKQGESIAIFVAGERGGYLYYSVRDYGINLEFSPTPKYEWETRGCEPLERNESVRIKEKVALYNTTHNDYVIYCRREYGINLRWAKDCNRVYNKIT